MSVPHIITVKQISDYIDDEEKVIASATTADRTQQKTFNVKGARFIVRRRYLVGGDPAEDVHDSYDSKRAVKAYNKLG